MNKLLLILSVLVCAYTSYAQPASVPNPIPEGLCTQCDYAEKSAQPTFNWPSPKANPSTAPKYMMVTGVSGSTYGNPSATPTAISMVSAGELGAPTPLFGSDMYRFKLDFANRNTNVRTELYAGSGCGELTSGSWMGGFYIPSTTCLDSRPYGMMFDQKHANAQGPASCYVKIVYNGSAGRLEYYLTRQWPQEGTPGSTEYYYPTNVPVEYDKWVYFWLRRNYKNDNTGYMELYMWVQGTTPEFTLKASVYGPNYATNDCEGYWLWGPYLWNNQGTGSCDGQKTYIWYYDNLMALKPSFTITDANNFISGASSPGDTPPSVNAGADKTVTLPTSSSLMTATITAGTNPIETIAWTQLSGPNTATITTPTIEDPTMSGLIAGTYNFRVTATDDEGVSASDDVVVVVQSAPSGVIPRWTDAFGNTMAQRDTSIGEAVGAVTYTANAQADGTGYIAQMLITQISGPSTATFNYAGGSQTGWQPTSLTLPIEDLIPGTYVLRLSAEDGDGNLAYDTINVVVVPAVKDPPIANAGSDQIFYVNGNGPSTVTNATLYGVATGVDTTILSREWTLLAGDQSMIFITPSADTTAISLLVRGTYYFRYTVTDNNNLSDVDTVMVDVRSVDAGLDTSISAPVTSAPLMGTVYGSGTPVSYSWTMIAGSGGSITNSTSLNATAVDLAPGNYTFQIAIEYAGGEIVVDTKNVSVVGGSRNYHIRTAWLDEKLIQTIKNKLSSELAVKQKYISLGTD